MAKRIKRLEFTEIALDTRFRESKTRYDPFVRALICKRLTDQIALPDDESRSKFLNQQFVQIKGGMTDPIWKTFLKDTAPRDRPHFMRFRQVLTSYGQPETKFNAAFEKLKNEDEPIIEKFNLMLVYQELARGTDFDDAVNDVSVRSGRQARKSLRERVSNISSTLR